MNDPSATHIANRDQILQALTEELFGPSPQGDELDCAGELKFATDEEFYRPWRQKSTGEEILQRDRPVKRYGIGVLYPVQVPVEGDPLGPGTEEEVLEDLESTVAADEAGGQPEPPPADAANQGLEKIVERGRTRGEPDTDDYELSLANQYRPSTMAVTFLAEIAADSVLEVNATGGRYSRKEVSTPSGERFWWLRTPVSLTATFTGSELLAAERLAGPALEVEGLVLEVVVYPRLQESGSESLMTVCLVNRSGGAGRLDENCLFQATFTATVGTAGGPAQILPYPEREVRVRDEEEESLALLHREAKTFAVGHGCAADWSDVQPGERVAQVVADPLPQFEAPNITPDVPGEDMKPIAVPMSLLAGLHPPADGLDLVTGLFKRYESWISDAEKRIGALDSQYHEAAKRHISECKAMLKRMNAGISYLRGNERALKAFQLANEAVLLQQIRGRPEPRRLSYDKKRSRLVFDSPYAEPDPLSPPEGRGSWRPFQIAFLLATLRSVVDPDADDRETVDLIWFPTGGGKTEAYLALTAFSLFYRRLRDPSDDGVDVLMRYTLRLLTAQQFQRASALICAMEFIRDREPELGDSRFTIGIWLGGGITPNSRQDARAALRRLNEGDSENEFLVVRCPWCSGQIGPLQHPRGTSSSAPKVAGYERREQTVAILCNEEKCFFYDGLPVYVIDEDIYEERPSLIIGTVDKFAALAWRPEARSLFGIGEDGERETSPPGLIVQDELHLISGPLGSMVGLYEGMIEEFCTDRRGGQEVLPKIVSSTATIRRYEDQVRALYAREDVALFPPRGLEAGNSFFARYARRDDGTLFPGRIYLGVHGPGLGSLQTAQVRTFASLLQAPVPYDSDGRDPWWTLLVFFNSLRELGTSLSLLQSDIPDYLKVIRNRFGLAWKEVRKLREVFELTGRLRNDEVPAAIASLEVTTTSGSAPIDACLASNIIEVGIDIDRLSLMAVVGQPKTTSQYIQVTGRVGRRWNERPGLVVTIYSASKPRDRSHFEKFRTYHERLYAQVEPTSVTPFSPPVLDRALHAALVSFVRQTGSPGPAGSPFPFPGQLVDAASEILLKRVKAVDPPELERLKETLKQRLAEWERWEPIEWSAIRKDGNTPLLRRAGEYISPADSHLSWQTPTSLRNVDAECQAEITRLYALDTKDGSSA